MARISASIPDDLKDALYQLALDEDLAISHVVTKALETYLQGGHATTYLKPAGSNLATEPSSEPVNNSLEALTAEMHKLNRDLVAEVRELKKCLARRSSPETARYF